MLATQTEIAEEMAIFDELPAEVRRALSRSRRDWDVRSVAERLRQGVTLPNLVAFLRDN